VAVPRADGDENYALPRVALTLTPIVATATGEQRRLEVPNQISQIDANEGARVGAGQHVSDLLVAKAAGVSCCPARASAPRAASASADRLAVAEHRPIVIMDGVRINS
jgi:hypothetical protein